MMTLRSAAVAAAALITAAAPAARAAQDDASVRDGASLDAAMRQYGQSRPDEVAWYNPYLPEASGSYVAPAEASDALAEAGPNESADQHLMRIVAQYRRPMLDRGGWANPYLPSTGLGNPMLAVAVGSGLTSPAAEPAQPSRRGSVASGPKDEDEEEVGAGSGEPELPQDAPPPAK
jgi:hypothetical protein